MKIIRLMIVSLGRGTAAVPGVAAESGPIHDWPATAGPAVIADSWHLHALFGALPELSFNDPGPDREDY